ncbi:MAG: hypothetical protein EPN91_09355 [Salinibacterium sp.]|nr:MAG: hypothetical protein EPN91_09355 [Salinibacterium sp.]
MSEKREHELAVKDEMERCIHFTGIHNDACNAGVNYRALVGGEYVGWATAIPCTGTRFRDKHDRAIVPCSLHTLPTLEAAEETVTKHEETVAAVIAHVKSGTPLPLGVSVMICRTPELESFFRKGEDEGDDE